MSTRSAALGEVGVAFLSGASAFHANPAGLADEKEEARSSAPWGVAGEAALAHHEALGNLRQDAISVDLTRGREALAASLNTLYSEGIEETDEVGNRTGDFGLVDLEVGLGYARRLSDTWRVGFTGGYVRERIADAAAATWAASAGTIWTPPGPRGLTLGAAVGNLGGNARFTFDGRPGDEVSLPLTARAGAAYRRSFRDRGAWMIAADVRKASQDDATGHAGLEVTWMPVSLRAGTRLGTDVGHFTAGLGLEAGRFRFDYAFLPTGEVLGTSHRAELSARFGL